MLNADYPPRFPAATFEPPSSLTITWADGLTDDCSLVVGRDGSVFCAAHGEPFDPAMLAELESEN